MRNPRGRRRFRKSNSLGKKKKKIERPHYRRQLADPHGSWHDIKSRRFSRTTFTCILLLDVIISVDFIGRFYRLPVLRNIPPPRVRREKAARRERSEYASNTSLPHCRQDTSNQNPVLKSRKPAYLTTTELIENQYDRTRTAEFQHNS